MKAWLELGAIGLAVVVALLVTIVYRGVRAHFMLRDPSLRVASAALLGVVIWSLVYAVKGQYLDLDPLNVYFWLFAGMLFKLPALEDPEPPGEAPVEEPKQAVVA